MTRLKQVLYLCAFVCILILLSTFTNLLFQPSDCHDYTLVTTTRDNLSVPSSSFKTYSSTGDTYSSTTSTTSPPTSSTTSPPSTVAKLAPKNKSSVAWSKNIDFVIPWSGQSTVHKNGTDVSRERNNNELRYLLRSIAQHAPWFHRMYIVVNKDALPTDPVDIPASIANRTQILDRCTYMPAGTCPTRNSHAVKAFLHRIPGLKEHFVIGDDDIFFGRPVTASHFFKDGKPFVWRKKPTWGFFNGQEFHRIYKDPSVVSFATPQSAAPSPHFWYPQLKSVCVEMERQFPEFYAFVGSHTEGRYSSLARGISDEHNSQEECFVGFMNWELVRTGKGVYNNIDSKRYVWWDEININKAGFQKAVRDRAIFMNVNDRFSKDERRYNEEMTWFHNAMEKMFPKQPAVFKKVNNVS